MKKRTTLILITAGVLVGVVAAVHFGINYTKSPATKLDDTLKKTSDNVVKSQVSLKQLSSLKFTSTNDYQTMVNVTANDLDSAKSLPQ